MNAEMAEQENKENSEVKGEAVTDDGKADDNQTNVADEKTEKKT